MYYTVVFTYTSTKSCNLIMKSARFRGCEPKVSSCADEPKECLRGRLVLALGDLISEMYAIDMILLCFCFQKNNCSFLPADNKNVFT